MAVRVVLCHVARKPGSVACVLSIFEWRFKTGLTVYPFHFQICPKISVTYSSFNESIYQTQMCSESFPKRASSCHHLSFLESEYKSLAHRAATFTKFGKHLHEFQ